MVNCRMSTTCAFSDGVSSALCFILRAPRISERSTEPLAETNKFKRSTWPTVIYRLSASQSCLLRCREIARITAESPNVAHSMKMCVGVKWSQVTTSKKISFFLCLMPSDRQDLNQILAGKSFEAINSSLFRFPQLPALHSSPLLVVSFAQRRALEDPGF